MTPQPPGFVLGELPPTIAFQFREPLLCLYAAFQPRAKRAPLCSKSRRSDSR